MRPLNEMVFNSTNAAGNLASSAIHSANLLSASVQAIATGTINGTLKLQGSNDPGSPQQNTTPTNWSDIPSATAAIAGAGVVLLPKTDLVFQWIRVTYTASSGAGNLTANVNAFGF